MPDARTIGLGIVQALEAMERRRANDRRRKRRRAEREFREKRFVCPCGRTNSSSSGLCGICWSAKMAPR